MKVPASSGWVCERQAPAEHFTGISAFNPAASLWCVLTDGETETPEVGSLTLGHAASELRHWNLPHAPS